MAEIRTATTLKRKRDQIERAIAGYEASLAQAKADLAHINAALAIMEGNTGRGGRDCYVNIERLFGYGEIAALSAAALAAGDLTTPQITLRIMAAKGMDTGDKVLAKRLCLTVVQSLRGLARRRRVAMVQKVQGVCIWRLTSEGAAASSLSIGAKPALAQLTSQSR
jgi:hypothetical protein